MLPRSMLRAVLMPNTAKIASRMPTRPSPAIIPAQNRVPLVVCSSLVAASTFLRLSMNQRTAPPIMMEVFR